MSERVPAALPIFRSEHQLRLLGLLFAHRGVELPITALAAAAGVSQATTSREVERLEAYGILSTRLVGRNRFATANWQLPWADHLAAILAQTVGAPAIIADAIADVHGVEAAYIFGSWAARHLGEPGPLPRDIDLLVIGNVDYEALLASLNAAEAQLGIDINPVVKTAAAWADAQDPFLTELRSRPLVDLALPAERNN